VKWSLIKLASAAHMRSETAIPQSDRNKNGSELSDLKRSQTSMRNTFFMTGI